jgi:hypothetical protein
MSPTIQRVLYWAPRVSGVALTVFLSAFALDASDGVPPGNSTSAYAMHLLPASVCAALMAVAWRFRWIGTIGFGALAVGYALLVQSRPDWIVAISGPLAITSFLFAVSPARPASERTTVEV